MAAGVCKFGRRVGVTLASKQQQAQHPATEGRSSQTPSEAMVGGPPPPLGLQHDDTPEENLVKELGVGSEVPLLFLAVLAYLVSGTF